MKQLSLEKKDIYNRYLAAHHLYPRLDQNDILTACQTVGLQDYFFASLEVFLAARVADIAQEDVKQLWKEQKLMRTVGLEDKVKIIATKMWGVFNGSLAFRNRTELEHMLGPIEELIALLGIDIFNIYKLLIKTTTSSLKNKRRSKKYLYESLSQAVLSELTASQREIWYWPSSIAEGQTLGDSIIDILLPTVGFAVPIVLEKLPGRPDYQFTLANTFQEPNTAELVRQFVHAYGPTNAEEFATWAGITISHAQRLWLALPQDELVLANYGENTGYVLAKDCHEISHAPIAEGVRFIGPYDPLLHIPQRNLLVSGKTLFTYFFRAENRPGMVLYDGKVVAGWHFKSKKRTFSILIEDIGESFGRIATDELTAAIAHLGRVLGMENEGFSHIGV